MFQPDVIVVGSGLIGLGCATAIAREGLRVLVLSSSERGAASGVSAGILAPSVGDAPPPARALGFLARDLYPGYLDALESRTGRRVRFHQGLLEVALHETQAADLRARLPAESEWIDAFTLGTLEPSLRSPAGAALHRADGAVDSALLLDALSAEATSDPRVVVADGRVNAVHVDRKPLVAELDGGRRIEADSVVLAAGAWVATIRGLPRPLPVVPVRGQILVVEGVAIRHPVMGPSGYIVPRPNLSLIGSTMEYVGFDARTTETGAAVIRQAALELSASFARCRTRLHWAGLRPVTPDFLPVVGAEPYCDGLFYACGHSRNGVLLTPLTAKVIAELISRGAASIDVGPYAPDRFGQAGR